MRFLAPLLIVFLLVSPLFAQYEVTNPYLIHPELAIDYVDSCASFWFTAYDDEVGGFYTNVDRQGQVISSWGTQKNMISQSRDAYGMVRAYMLTGDETYLEYAEGALTFQYDHGWDGEYGGWFDGIAEDGTPTNVGNDKSAFNQHYALLGPLAMFEATGDSAHFEQVLAGYEWLEEHLWDDRPDYSGYYDHVNRSGSTARGKSFNATVDAITTHLLYLYLMTGEEQYRERLDEIAHEIRIRLVDSMEDQAIGFVEEYTSDWAPDNSETMTIMGHVLKSGWCLARVNQLLPNAGYVSDAQVLVDEVWDNGYDHDFGGPYKDYNRLTGEMLMWGLADTAKAWWQMEQAIVAGLQLFDTVGEERYLQMADETLTFFMQHFVDHEYGDVYSDRTRYGAQAWGDEKGSGGKAAYHSVETGYYTYLYGSLFVQHQPVTLYYRFNNSDVERDITLSPLAWRPEAYRIASVEKDGEEYTDFDGDGRILTLASGIAGEFAVTFEPTGINSVESDYVVSLPDGLELLPAYPNPFNSMTSIRYNLAHAAPVRLRIYNNLGQEVATLRDELSPAGAHNVIFTTDMLASGVYFVVLESENAVKRSRLILVK